MFAYRSIGGAGRLAQKFGSASRSYFSKAVTSHKLTNHTKILPSSSSTFFRQYSAKTESSLADFLKEEIEAEKEVGKQQLAGQKQPDIPGFQVKTDQREVILTKQHGTEKITVTFDVNHSVDSDSAVETPPDKPSEQQQQDAQMMSKPSFAVEIAKGDQKLVFECSFVEPDYSDEGASEEYADLFNIEEIYMFTGEMGEKNKIYAVSGGIVDGTLYDHLMNYLEERGVNNDFAQNLTRFATFYEHGQYVNLLQKLKDFVAH